MPSVKRRWVSDSLADSVNIISLDDDDNLIEHEYSGEGQDYWTRARAQLTSVWDHMFTIFSLIEHTIHPFHLVLTYQQHNLFNRPDGGPSFSEVPIYDPSAPDDNNWNDVDIGHQIPVGEEGAMNSHMRGEYDMHSLLSSLLEDAPKHIDMRDRCDQTEKWNNSWRCQLLRQRSCLRSGSHKADWLTWSKVYRDTTRGIKVLEIAEKQ
ncbi:hypothetical protein PQX77_014663 [Marasmius sp. AFHP31]|nr:hypothetical protein PQX77_014663 [Marasmius sp. AFHP31]